MVVISIQNNLIENNIEIKFNILEDLSEEFNLKLNVEDERFNYDKFINLYESFLDFNELFNSNLNFKYSLNTNLDLYNIESNILNLNKYDYYNIINFNILDNENIRLINSNILNIFDKNYSKLLNLLDLAKDYVLEKEKSFINLNKILDLNLLRSLNILLEYEITDLTSNLYRYIDLYNWNIISINRPIIGVELLNTDLSNILLSNINENNNGNFQINSDNIDIISNLIKNETTSNNYFIKIKKNIFSLNEFYIKPEINYIYNYPINFIKNEYSYDINFYINDITISDYNNNNHSLNINIKDSRLNLLSNSLVNEEITIIFYETICNINDNINRLLNYNTNINYDINIISYSDISLDSEKNLYFQNINYTENFILNLNLTYRFKDDYLSTYNDEYNNIIKLNIIDLRIVYIFNSYIENNNFIIIDKDNIDIDFLNILNNYIILLFPSDIFDNIIINIELNTLTNDEKNIDDSIYTIYQQENNIIKIKNDQYSGIWNDRITINLTYNDDELSLNNSYNFIFKDIRFDLLNQFLKNKNKTIINLINNKNKYYLTDVFDIIEQFGLIYYEINPIPVIYNLNSEKEYKLLKSDNYYFEFNSNIFYEKEFELNINILLCNINCNFDLNFKFNDIKYDILLDTIFNIRFTTYIINDNFSYNLNNLSDSLLGFDFNDFNFILNQNDYIKIENNILNLCNISTYSIYSNLIDLNVSIQDKDNDFKLIIYDLRYTLLLNLNLNLNKSIINIYDDFNFNNLNLNKNQIIYNNIEEYTYYYVIIENSNIEFNNKYLYKHEIELNYIINFDYIDIDLNSNIYLIELNIIDKRYNLVFENLVFNSNINITNEKDIINLFNVFSNLNNELNISISLISFNNILPNLYYYNIIESNIYFNNNYEYTHNITIDIIIDNYDNNSNINLSIIDKRYNLLRQKIENYLNDRDLIVINNDNYENYNIKEKINELNLLSNNIILDNINIEYETSDNYTIKDDKIEFIKNKNISNIKIKIKFDDDEIFENILFINIDIINRLLLLSDISILINNSNITNNINLYDINIYNYNYDDIELIYDYSNIIINIINNYKIQFNFNNLYIYDYFNFDLTFKDKFDERFTLNLSFNDKRYDLLLNEIELNLNNNIYISDISNISTIYLNNINKKGNIINFSTSSEYFIFNNEILNLKENYLNTYINKEFTFNINLSILEYSNIKILTGYDLRYDILLNEIKNSEIINLDIEISSSLENDLEELNYYFNNNLILKGHNINGNILKIDENNDGLDDYNKINDKFISNIDNNKIYYYLPINVLYYCDYYEIKVNYYLIIEFINEITISLDDTFETYNIISSV